MEVLDILKKNGAELYPEDLAFFEAELDTGEYSLAYIDECKRWIREIRSWKKQTAAQANGDSGVPGNAFVQKIPTGAQRAGRAPDGAGVSGEDRTGLGPNAHGFQLQDPLQAVFG